MISVITNENLRQNLKYVTRNKALECNKKL
jgi:hypothetical protein